MKDGIDFDALLDGELPEPEAAALRARIDADEELRRAVEQRRRLVEAVRALPLEPAPPELAARVGAALPERRARGGNVLRGWWTPFAAAAALLVAFLVWPRERPATTWPTEARQPEKASPAGSEKRAEAEELDTAGLKTLEAEADADAPGDAADGRGLAAGARDRKGAPRAAPSAKSRRGRRIPEAPGAERPVPVPESDRLVAETVRGEPLRGERMPAYLRALGAFERAKLARHIESFGVVARSAVATAPATEAKSRTEKTAASTAAVQLALASGEEAEQVAALLRRAYPGEARRGKQKGRGREEGARGAGYSAKVSGAKRSFVAVEIEATKPQLDRIRTWLDRISTRWRLEHANKMARVGVTGLPAAAAKPQRWRIELAYPAKPK